MARTKTPGAKARGNAPQNKPVLRLLIEPEQKTPHTGGGIRILPQYRERRNKLKGKIGNILNQENSGTLWFAQRSLIHVVMDENCLAPSWMPEKLFSDHVQARFVAPWRDGYLIEVSKGTQERLLDVLDNPTSQRQQQDISAVKDVLPFHESLGNEIASDAWEKARSRRGNRAPTFIATLAPFADRQARVEVAALVRRIFGNARAGESASRPKSAAQIEKEDQTRGLSSLTFPAFDASHSGSGLAPYVNGKTSRLVITANNEEDLTAALKAGAVVHWSAVTPLAPTAPELEFEPDELPVITDGLPIVGVIDGGLTSNRYRSAVAWEEESFISPRYLDDAHGNSIAGLIVDAHAWNDELSMPKLYCRLGLAPAVPNENYMGPWDFPELISYIDTIVGSHTDTKVWNVSANLDYSCDPLQVSEFGHALHDIARRHEVLFVISSGNRDPDFPEVVAPPADASAGITVSGRRHKRDGTVGNPCEVSRTGRGPDGMLKPELSWFSVQRTASNDFGQASSWAAPLVSRLAAHTWEKLQEPTPNLVKGLLLNAADHSTYKLSTGFGSPIKPELPWLTSGDRAVITWPAQLTEGYDYTWSGIKIPRNLIRNGKLVGRVRFIAILDAETQMVGPNYFSTRIQASVRYQNEEGKWDRLVGSLKTETAENLSRKLDNKWQPVRCDVRTCGDLSIGNDELRVQARLFWRDRFRHPGVDFDQYLGAATFVLSFESIDGTPVVHDEFVSLMGDKVTTALSVNVTTRGT